MKGALALPVLSILCCCRITIVTADSKQQSLFKRSQKNSKRSKQQSGKNYSDKYESHDSNNSNNNNNRNGNQGNTANNNTKRDGKRNGRFYEGNKTDDQWDNLPKSDDSSNNDDYNQGVANYRPPPPCNITKTTTVWSNGTITNTTECVCVESWPGRSMGGYLPNYDFEQDGCWVFEPLDPESFSIHPSDTQPSLYPTFNPTIAPSIRPPVEHGLPTIVPSISIYPTLPLLPSEAPSLRPSSTKNAIMAAVTRHPSQNGTSDDLPFHNQSTFVDETEMYSFFCNVSIAVPAPLRRRLATNYLDVLIRTTNIILNETLPDVFPKIVKPNKSRSTITFVETNTTEEWWVSQIAYSAWATEDFANLLRANIREKIYHAIESGRFLEIAKEIAPETVAVSKAGEEGTILNDVPTTAPVGAPISAPTELSVPFVSDPLDHQRWIGLGIFTGTFLFLVILMSTATGRRKKQEEQEHWGIQLGTDHDVCQMLNVGWDGKMAFEKEKLGYRDDDSIFLGGYQQTETAPISTATTNL